MKKLWAVLYETEIVVYAETEDEATKIADRHRRDAESDHTRTYEMGRCLPYGWDSDCVPYGEDELSIADILALPSGGQE